MAGSRMEWIKHHEAPYSHTRLVDRSPFSFLVFSVDYGGCLVDVICRSDKVMISYVFQ